MKGFVLLISIEERIGDLLHILYYIAHMKYAFLERTIYTERHKVENRGSKWMERLMGSIKLSTHVAMPAEQM